MATVTGKIKYFNPQKGYGFIEMEDGTAVYVHSSAIIEGHIRNMLFKDETVTCEIVEGRRGPEAVDVVVDKPDRVVRFVPTDDSANQRPHRDFLADAEDARVDEYEDDSE